MPILTPLQQKRRDAAFKAAATKRAKQGLPPKPNAPFPPSAPGVPKPTPTPVWTAPPPPPRPTPPPPSASWAPPPPPRPTPPPPQPAAFTPKRGNLWATPKPNVNAQRLVVLAAIEDFFAVKKAAINASLTPAERDEWNDLWKKYEKVKTSGLRNAASTADANEAAVALSTAACLLIKKSFTS